MKFLKFSKEIALLGEPIAITINGNDTEVIKAYLIEPELKGYNNYILLYGDKAGTITEEDLSNLPKGIYLNELLHTAPCYILGMWQEPEKTQASILGISFIKIIYAQLLEKCEVSV